MSSATVEAPTRMADIDSAMGLGLKALAEARISIKETPVFLVVGLAKDDEALFRNVSTVGGRIRLVDPRLPVRWYGDEHALWLTLPGISAISVQADKSRQMPAPRPRVEFPPYMAGSLSELERTLSPSMAAGPGATMMTLGGMQTQDPFRTTQGPTQGGQGAVDFHRTMAVGSVGSVHDTLLAGEMHQLSEEELERIRSQLRHFVRLLREVRDPVVPINGILVHLPVEWLSDPSPARLVQAIRTDLVALQQELGVNCVCMLVLSALDRVPEFVEYVRRLEPKQVRRRNGCGFPDPVHLDVSDVEKAHSWLVRYFESQVFLLFRKGLRHPGNPKLFRLLDNFRRSRLNFVQLVSSGFPDELGAERFFFGGVYLASLKRIGEEDRPFYDGIPAKMTQEHDDALGWTQRVRRSDGSYRRWGWCALALAVVVGAAGLFFAVDAARLVNLG